MDDVLDLNNLDGIARNGVPHEWLTHLRNTDPVYRHEASGSDSFWLITRHKDAITVTRDWQNFSSDNANGGIVGLTEAQRRRRIDTLVENSLVTMDPPEHSKYRQVVMRALFPRAVAACEVYIRKQIVALLDAAIKKGVCDFVEDVALWIPVEMLAELGNIPKLDRAMVLKWVNASLSPDDPDYAPSFDEVLKSRRALQNYCRDLYEVRKHSPGQDAISLMIEGKIDDLPISASHAAAFFEILLAAGSETTRTAMAHGVLAFAQFPEQYQLLRENRAMIETAVEEILRWASPTFNYPQFACRS